MEGLQCSFRSPRTPNLPKGTLIEMGALVSKQCANGTTLPRELIIPFARAVEPCYACKLTVEHSATGFTFTFVTEPTRGMYHEAETITVARHALIAAIREHDPMEPGPPTLVGLYKPAALDVLRWFLAALSGKPHTVAVKPEAITWDPPTKPPGYAPLPKPPSKDKADEGPPTDRSPPQQPQQKRRK